MDRIEHLDDFRIWFMDAYAAAGVTFDASEKAQVTQWHRQRTRDMAPWSAISRATARFEHRPRPPLSAELVARLEGAPFEILGPDFGEVLAPIVECSGFLATRAPAWVVSHKAPIRSLEDVDRVLEYLVEQSGVVGALDELARVLGRVKGDLLARAQAWGRHAMLEHRSYLERADSPPTSCFFESSELRCVIDRVKAPAKLHAISRYADVVGFDDGYLASRLGSDPQSMRGFAPRFAPASFYEALFRSSDPLLRRAAFVGPHFHDKTLSDADRERFEQWLRHARESPADAEAAARNVGNPSNDFNNGLRRCVNEEVLLGVFDSAVPALRARAIDGLLLALSSSSALGIGPTASDLDAFAEGDLEALPSRGAFFASPRNFDVVEFERRVAVVARCLAVDPDAFARGIGEPTSRFLLLHALPDAQHHHAVPMVRALLVPKHAYVSIAPMQVARLFLTKACPRLLVEVGLYDDLDPKVLAVFIDAIRGNRHPDRVAAFRELVAHPGLDPAIRCELFDAIERDGVSVDDLDSMIGRSIDEWRQSLEKGPKSKQKKSSSLTEFSKDPEVRALLAPLGVPLGDHLLRCWARSSPTYFDREARLILSCLATDVQRRLAMHAVMAWAANDLRQAYQWLPAAAAALHVVQAVATLEVAIRRLHVASTIVAKSAIHVLAAIGGPAARTALQKVASGKKTFTESLCAAAETELRRLARRSAV